MLLKSSVHKAWVCKMWDSLLCDLGHSFEGTPKSQIPQKSVPNFLPGRYTLGCWGSLFWVPRRAGTLSELRWCPVTGTLCLIFSRGQISRLPPGLAEKSWVPLLLSIDFSKISCSSSTFSPTSRGSWCLHSFPGLCGINWFASWISILPV